MNKKEQPHKISGEAAVKMVQKTIDNWGDRYKRMVCARCMFWVEKGETSLGRCRKHAPEIDGWPPTFQSDWCGDFKLDENKL